MENNDASMGWSYFLEVKIPDQHSRKIEINDHVLAGLDPRNDLILIDPKVLPKHFLFQLKNDILTVLYSGRTGETFLNGLALENGKLYILEKGDVLTVGNIQIDIVKLKHHKNPKSPSMVKLPPLPQLSNRDIPPEIKVESPEQPVIKENIPSTTKVTKISKNKEQVKDAFRIIPYKVYGFFLDVALSYFLLSFVIPKSRFLKEALDFLFPISAYSLEALSENYGPSKASAAVAMIEFFVCFHLCMIFFSLLAGSTPGALILGISRSKKSGFFARRFKAYLYALLNVFVLPLVLFDIPFLKGKNLKEILTLSSSELKNSFFFRLSRRVFAPNILILSFLSPLFLGLPYSADVTELKVHAPKFVDTHTYALKTFSSELGIGLTTEINQNYALLPLFETKKLGLAFYDFKNKNVLILKEEDRLNSDRAFFNLRYANPFMGFFMPANELDQVLLKQKSTQSLKLNLERMIQGMKSFGPFMANGFLFKGNFLNTIDARTNQALLYTFNEKNPALYITQEKNGKVFLFTRKYIVEFNMFVPQKGEQLEAFIRSILAPMMFNQGAENVPSMPGPLEAFDAFEKSNYQTLLTYYANEAKKARGLKNDDWTEFLKKNIEQTKKALFSDLTRVRLNKSIEKSFDDILKTLM